MKVILAPGAFDNVPEDEQEELFKEIEAMVEDGSFFEKSEPINMDTLEEDDPELYAVLMKQEQTLQ